MDRFDWKLVGKKEMYVPYNGYKLMYAKDIKPALTPNHVNPDFMRWELHRVWVVEATLKPGQRDLYSKRVFYLDEDSWVALAADQYDAKGQLYRSTLREHDVQLRRERREHRQLHVPGLLVRRRTPSSAPRACRTAFATSIRCPNCSGRRNRSQAPESDNDNRRRLDRRAEVSLHPRAGWFRAGYFLPRGNDEPA